MNRKLLVQVYPEVEFCSTTKLTQHLFRVPKLVPGQTMILVVRLSMSNDLHAFREFRRSVVRHIVGLALERQVRETDIHHTKNGKPALKETKAWFNVSHSKDLLAIAVSRWAEVGIDIEIPRSVDVKSLARRVLHPEDPQRLQEIANFFECWTLKEAVVKAWGSGLSRALNAIQLTELKNSAWLSARYDTDTSIVIPLDELELPYGCRAALAFNASYDPDMLLHDFPQVVYG